MMVAVPSESGRRIRQLAGLGRVPTVGLVGATRLRGWRPAKAANLFSGRAFRAAVARSLNTYDETYIFTSAHGVSDLKIELNPVTRRATNMTGARRREWALSATSRLADLFPFLAVNFYLIHGSTILVRELEKMAKSQGWPWSFFEPTKGLPMDWKIRWLECEEG